MSKVLAIDVGEKRVGLSTCDELRMIASPFGFMPREGAIAKIAALVTAEDIGQIVIGLPQLKSGDMGTQAEDIRSFAKEIGAIVAVPIDFENEILTSVEATNRLKMMNRKIKDKGEVDAMAATIIMESYLNRSDFE